MSTDNLAQAQALLAERDQATLLEHFRTLNPAQQQRLLADLRQVDWALLETLTRSRPKPGATDLAPASYYPARPRKDQPELHRLYARARAHGEQLIGQGKVCALTVAGGQGTRLGFDGPKGCLAISPVKNKSLFELFADQIAASGARYRTPLHWFIMTSPANDAATRNFFSAKHSFGLDPRQMHFFSQGVMPVLELDGRVLLEQADRLAFAPDGHGGALRALHRSGSLRTLRQAGIEQISYFQVDNPMVRAVDPLFVGLHALAEARMSSKVVRKRDPSERVGNVCLAGGATCVVEYSELPDALARQTNEDGSLRFALGSIAVHMLSVAFVETLTAERFALPFHRARKKATYLNSAGRRVEPTEPNAIKLEAFVFDALPLAQKTVTLETLREEEFAPVKNADGPDSPASCKRLQSARAARWLRAAGVRTSPAAALEISARYALDAEALKRKLSAGTKVAATHNLYLE